MSTEPAQPERSSRSSPPARWSPRARWTVGVLVALLVLLLVTATAVGVLSLRVDGDSMSPTLRSGQRILTTPDTGGTAHRFDVVVLDRPGDDAKIVKRVIALPGDTVRITPDRSGAEVDLRPAGTDRWYRVTASTWTGRWGEVTGCCTTGGRATGRPTAAVVPAGDCFVLGDDPGNSSDSRSFGWVRLSAIQARVGLRVWPLDAIGGIGNRPRLHPIG